MEQDAQCGNCCNNGEFSSTAFGVTKNGRASGMVRISSICSWERNYSLSAQRKAGRKEQLASAYTGW